MARSMLVIIGCLDFVAGHGAVRSPFARNQLNATSQAVTNDMMWFNQGCFPGCEQCIGGKFGFDKPDCNGTLLEPSLVSPGHRTIYPDTPSGSDADITKYMPWRNPGRAPILDPCGVMGGWTADNTINGGFVIAPYKAGDKGSALPPLSVHTEWVAGSVVEVEWFIGANHGGGYQWRICPQGQESSEACFIRRPLEFASNETTLRFPNGTKVGIPATRVTQGTFPEGSEWRRNPIPTCTENDGAGTNPYGPQNPCQQPMFTPPEGCDSDCWGYNYMTNEPTLIDSVRIPEDVAGDFVLQWRWDCEQTAQVWTSCADVTIAVTGSVQV